MRLVLIFLAGLLLAAPPASGFSLEEASDSPDLSIIDYIDDFIELPEGALDWKMLGTTGEIPVESIDDHGFDYTYVRPDFPPAVSALDGQEVIVKGYMFPLGGEERQPLFLLGPFPLSCPFHYHVGPALVIEAHAAQYPVPFSYDPVTLTGRLELVEDDPELSTFYRLKDARLAKQ